MRNISLSSVLVFTLLIPFIMTYNIGIGTTPYWLFGSIFLAMLLFPLLDIAHLSDTKRHMYKHILMWITIIVVLGAAFISAIVVRHQTSPIFMIHDIILQLEAAIRFFLHGTNPYSATYFNTPMADWGYSTTEVNPALYHFVMEPFYLLFSIPFYLITTRTVGFFDGRIPLLFLFFCALFIGDRLIKDPEKKLQFLALFAFNPAMLGYTLEGRSDVFVFAFLFGGLFFLYKKRYLVSAALLALAFCIKQSVWLVFPLYVAYLYFQQLDRKTFMKSMGVFFGIVAIIILPFFAWDPKAFIDSTINYLSGSVEHSYPISGYGFGNLLVQNGFIKDAHNYFPFTILQLVISLPVLVILIKYFKKDPTIHKLLVFYGIFLFIFWYFSRYFNNSHVGYLSMIFITAYFWPEPVNQKK